MAKISRQELSPKDDEYKRISKLFNKHDRTKSSKLVIKSIHRIDNSDLMVEFENLKENYKEKYGHVKVYELFHGTKDSNVDGILRINFDLNRVGENNYCRFGAGAAYSSMANYASHYTDEGPCGVLILFKVLVSEIIEVEENLNENPAKWLREPPIIPGRSPLRYDTTAKNANLMNVVIKFDPNSFCPTHEVRFTRQGLESNLKICTSYSHKLHLHIGYQLRL